MSHGRHSVEIELPLLLPEVTRERDRCVRTLTRMLRTRPGVVQAHVLPPSGDAPPQLCLHFDPAQLSVSRVRELARAAGTAIGERIGHLTGELRPAPNARAARTLGARLEREPGVLEAGVSASAAIHVEFDRKRVRPGQLEAVLREAGLSLGSHGPRVPDDGSAQHDHEHPVDHDKESEDEHGREAGDQGHDRGHGHEHGTGTVFGQYSELAFAGVGGTALLTGWLLERFGGGPSWMPLGFYSASLLASGWFTVQEALRNWKIRRFEIDTLMLVAALGAIALGRWPEAALLMVLFSLGHALEHWAMGRAKRAIEALGKLAPETAHRRRDGGTEEVPVASLQVGDVIVVRPNERLAADGLVVAGTSSVNQAPITGESVPVDKRPPDDVLPWPVRFDALPADNRVFAGTINGAGALEVRVARLAAESTLARVVTLVTEAESRQSPTQRFTARFERVFVPTVLALATILLFAWVIVDETFAQSFYRSMAVLVAASPCALAISVPSAVLSGVARAARSGILVKGGAALEELGALSALAFDKTGTLTEGKPRLTDVVPGPGVAREELIRVAWALERQSDHPLALAIVEGASRELGGKAEVPTASDVQSVTGRGITGSLEGQPVAIGKRTLFSDGPGAAPLPAEIANADAELAGAGRSTMIVRLGSRYLGVLGVMDTPRPQAAAAIRELRALGVSRLIMISGDNQRVADAVAAEVGLTEARGDMMPEDKVETIAALRAEFGRVGMVGDGVNDAPAMANATVGIAMGAAGSDVALEAADVALMSDDVGRLPLAVALSRETRRIIRQNLWVSLGVVAVLVPSTILGLSIGLAVLAHEGSTLVVVLNALRLLRFRERPLGELAPASEGDRALDRPA